MWTKLVAVSARRSRPLQRRMLHLHVVRHDGHDHGHHDHSHLSDIFDTKREVNRSAEQKLKATNARRVTLIGIASNVGMCVAKSVGGVVGNSAALIADAVHSVGDLLSDVVTLAALKYARKPVDDVYAWGYGKFESLGAMAVSGLLIISGASVIQHAIEAVHEHSAHPTSLALAIAGTSIFVKEFMYRITLKAGVDYDSKVLLANAWHHRSDALTSIVAVIGISGSMLGYHFLDGVCGIIVSALVIRMGGKTLIESTKDLMDASVKGHIVDDVRSTIRTVPGVLMEHDLRIRRTGPFLIVDVHCVVSATLTVSSAHQIAERVRLQVLAAFPQVVECLVHIDVEEDQGFEAKRSVNKTDVMRPLSDIQTEVIYTLLADNSVREVVDLRAHFLSHTLSIEVDIAMDEKLTVGEAQEHAKRLSELVKQGVRDVNDCCVHLALCGSGGHPRPLPLLDHDTVLKRSQLPVGGHNEKNKMPSEQGPT